MTNLFKITGTVTLKKGAGRQLKSGGMWVYDNEIDTFSETVEDGGLIELHDFDDYFMGIGFINPPFQNNSKNVIKTRERD